MACVCLCSPTTTLPQTKHRSGALEVLLFESFATNAGKGLRVRGRIEQGPLNKTAWQEQDVFVESVFCHRRNSFRILPVVPHKAVAEVSRIGNV